jgi:hypothetical protein
MLCTVVTLRKFLITADMSFLACSASFARLRMALPWRPTTWASHPHRIVDLGEIDVAGEDGTLLSDIEYM